MSKVLLKPGPNQDDRCQSCGSEIQPGEACDFCADWDEWMDSPQKALFDRICEEIRDRMIQRRLDYLNRIETGRMATPGAPTDSTEVTSVE